MKKGIDVSVYQGMIDWEKVKNEVDFVIMRCGLGDDLQSQDDKYFERNYSECVRLGIPFTVYFFSYAVTVSSVEKEISHIKRLLSGKTINGPVYIDIENTRGLNWRNITNDELLEIMKTFNKRLNDLGYKMGIYSSRSAFWNEKMTDPWYDNISKWVAQYGDAVTNFNRVYDIWQYTSVGRVNGINANVDMNIMYNEVISLPKPEVTHKSNEEIAQEVIQGNWGNGQDRKNRLAQAGYDYGTIQNIVNNLLKPQPARKSNEEIAKEVIRGLWGNGKERKDRLAQAGYDYRAVQNIVNQKNKRA